MSCCRVTCHLSSVMSSRGESAALGCDIIAHLDTGPWWSGGHWWTLWTLLDPGHTIMMSSSTDQWWVLGHCTHWTGGAQSAVGHTLYLVPAAGPGISISLYLGVIYANSLPPPDSSAALTMLPHLGNLLKLAYYSAAAERVPPFLTSILSKSLYHSFPSELQEGLCHGLPFVDRKPLLWFCSCTY